MWLTLSAPHLANTLVDRRDLPVLWRFCTSGTGIGRVTLGLCTGSCRASVAEPAVGGKPGRGAQGSGTAALLLGTAL